MGGVMSRLEQENSIERMDFCDDPAAVSRKEEAKAVLEMILALGRRADKLLSLMAQEADLNTPSYNLLRLADRKGNAGMTVSEAAAKVGIRPQALSGSVGEMVREGLLSRDVKSEDRRARILRITDEGRRRLAQTTSFRESLVDKVVSQVPQPSVAKLVLRKLEEAIVEATEK